jgi:hypothetical protein
MLPLSILDLAFVAEGRRRSGRVGLARRQGLARRHRRAGASALGADGRHSERRRSHRRDAEPSHLRRRRGGSRVESGARRHRALSGFDRLSPYHPWPQRPDRHRHGQHRADHRRAAHPSRSRRPQAEHAGRMGVRTAGDKGAVPGRQVTLEGGQFHPSRSRRPHARPTRRFHVLKTPVSFLGLSSSRRITGSFLEANKEALSAGAEYVPQGSDSYYGTKIGRPKERPERREENW